jgi:hypothetical protein
MTKIYQIYTTVHTPVGIFTGSAGIYYSEEEAFKERDGIQELLRDCDSFTIFSDDEPGTQITLTRELILNSVFALTVIHQDTE